MKKINDYDKAVLGFIVAALAYILNLDFPLILRVAAFAFSVPLFLLIASFVAYSFEWESNISKKVFSVFHVLISHNRHQAPICKVLIVVAPMLVLCIFIVCLFFLKHEPNGKINKNIPANSLSATIYGETIPFELLNVNTNIDNGTYIATFFSEINHYTLTLELPAFLEHGPYRIDRYNSQYRSTINIYFSDGESDYMLGGIRDVCVLNITYHDKNRVRFQGSFNAVLSHSDNIGKAALLPIIQNSTPSSSHDASENTEFYPEQIAIFDEFDFSNIIVH